MALFLSFPNPYLNSSGVARIFHEGGGGGGVAVFAFLWGSSFSLPILFHIKLDFYEGTGNTPLLKGEASPSIYADWVNGG